MKVFVTLVALWACVQAQSVRNPSGNKQSNDQHFHNPGFNKLYAKGQMPKNNYLDEAGFFVNITIGNPPQPFLVSVSTTHADLWVVSSKCTANTTYCQTNSKYDSDKSSTYIANGTEFKVFRNDNRTEGFLSSDTLRLGEVIVGNQTFAEMTKYEINHIVTLDGKLGFAYPSGASSGALPVLDQLFAKKLIPSLTFSTYKFYSEDHYVAKILLGKVEHKYYEGELTYVPVIKTGEEGNRLWIIQMDSLTVEDGNNKTTVCKDGRKAVLVSDEFYINGPKSAIDKIHKAIGAVTQDGFVYTVNCNNLMSLPNVTFTFGGKDFTLDPTEYTIGLYNTSGYICRTAFTDSDVPESSPWFIGTAFMAKYLTVFDRESDRVGIAKSIYYLSEQKKN